MLPSFRLIAATFLCGFLVVFAGLRLAASLNDMHEGLPVMAAHAAPVTVAPAADRETRRGLSSVPVMYDLRFAVSTVSPRRCRSRPAAVIDRSTPRAAVQSCRRSRGELGRQSPRPNQARRLPAGRRPPAPVTIDVRGHDPQPSSRSSRRSLAHGGGGRDSRSKPAATSLRTSAPIMDMPDPRSGAD